MKVREVELMNRRELLKKAGLGSAGLAAFPALQSVLATPAWARGEGAGDGFFFVVLSKLTTGPDLLAISGCGNVLRDSVVGEGRFFHFIPDEEPPFPLVATGFWTADELVGYTRIGNYGSATAGTLRMAASFHLQPDGKVVPGDIRINCNLAPGNLFTGLAEGVWVKVEGATFEPMDPTVGLTVFAREPISIG
jgi:hypothetical protein